MSGWNFESNGGSNKKVEFTKFPVGVTRIRVLGDSPDVRWTHWIQNAKRSINCPGKGCPICEIRKQQKANKETYTYAMSRRFAIWIYNYDTEKVELCEQGIGFFEDLKNVMDDIVEGGNKLSDAILKVRRKGTTKDDTTYRIDKDDIKPLSSSEREVYAEDIIDLKEFFKPHDPADILRIVKGEKWEDVFKREENASADEDVQLS